MALSEAQKRAQDNGRDYIKDLICAVMEKKRSV